MADGLPESSPPKPPSSEKPRPSFPGLKTSPHKERMPFYRHSLRLNPPTDYIEHAQAIASVIHEHFPDAMVEVLYGLEPVAEMTISGIDPKDDPRAWHKLAAALSDLAEGPNTRASAEHTRVLFAPEDRQELRRDGDGGAA